MIRGLEDIKVGDILEFLLVQEKLICIENNGARAEFIIFRSKIDYYKYLAGIEKSKLIRKNTHFKYECEFDMWKKTGHVEKINTGIAKVLCGKSTS